MTRTVPARVVIGILVRDGSRLHISYSFRKYPRDNILGTHVVLVPLPDASSSLTCRPSYFQEYVVVKGAVLAVLSTNTVVDA